MSDPYDPMPALEELFRQTRAKCYIRIERLFGEIQDQTTHAEEIARHHAETTGAVKSLENEVRRYKAKLRLAYRCGAEPPPGYDFVKKALSGDDVDDLVALDPDYMRLQDMLVTAQAGERYLDTMAPAFRDRGELMKELRWLAGAEAHPR